MYTDTTSFFTKEYFEPKLDDINIENIKIFLLNM